MKKTILLGLVSSSLLFSQASNAGEWGIGGLVGQVNADDICTGLQGCDDSDTTFGINVSYNFNKVWGAELGYVDLGDYSGSADLGFFGTFDVSADLSAAYLAGTGTYNFNDAWSLTGRLGFASANLDVRVSGAGSDDEFLTATLIHLLLG